MFRGRKLNHKRVKAVSGNVAISTRYQHA